MKKSFYLTLILTFVIGRASLSQSILPDSVQLSEVVVTAEKRSQHIKDLPTSVTSISLNRIESEKAKSLRNISAIVPNFYMPEYGSKLTSPVYIRGVGSRINSPSVGLYVDRVPYFEKSAFAFDFADVERIEVLRGPQGTLYGRNTMGGIINIVTRAPRNYRELRLSSDFGNYGYMKYNFSYNEPLTSKLAVLLNAGYTERDGYFTNNFHNESVGSDFTKNASLKVRYNPIKPLVLTYRLSGEKSYEKGYPYGVLDSTNTVKEINYNYKSRYNRDILDNSLTASLYFDKFVITSVSGMQYLKDNQAIDQDFMPKDYYQVQQGVKQNQYTQEIVVTTSELKNIDATLGVFGFIQDANRDIDLLYGSDIAQLKAPGLISGSGYVKYNNEENSGIATFGQATIKKIAGLFDLTLGLRYDYELNSLNYTYYTTKGETQTLKKDTLFKDSFSELLPKLALRFYLPYNSSAYFTTSKGYRGGGFNTAFVRLEDEVYSAEDSWNYEFGVKSNPFPFLSLNAAVFYIDWNNQQVSQRVPVGGNMIKNAGECYSKGLEFEFMATPLKNLQIGGNFGYTEAKYVDFKPNLSDTVNLKDYYLPFIPRYTFSSFIGYKVNFKSKYIKSAFAHLSIQGIGKQFWNDANDKSQGAYSIVNGTIGVENQWMSLSLWSKNMLNEKYFPYMFYVTNFKNWYAQKGHPLTFGVTLSVNISEKN
jgi:outer membrane receptor protein involved in Fe transport